MQNRTHLNFSSTKILFCGCDIQQILAALTILQPGMHLHMYRWPRSFELLMKSLLICRPSNKSIVINICYIHVNTLLVYLNQCHLNACWQHWGLMFSHVVSKLPWHHYIISLQDVSSSKTAAARWQDPHTSDKQISRFPKVNISDGSVFEILQS